MNKIVTEMVPGGEVNGGLRLEQADRKRKPKKLGETKRKMKKWGKEREKGEGKEGAAIDIKAILASIPYM